MMRRSTILLLFLAGCSKGPNEDLQYIKQARSLAAEWALVNEEAHDDKLTQTYVDSMHQWLHDGLETGLSSLTQPDSPYGNEMQSLLAEPQDAAPAELRARAEALKRIEDRPESA